MMMDNKTLWKAQAELNPGLTAIDRVRDLGRQNAGPTEAQREAARQELARLQPMVSALQFRVDALRTEYDAAVKALRPAHRKAEDARGLTVVAYRGHIAGEFERLRPLSEEAERKYAELEKLSAQLYHDLESSSRTLTGLVGQAAALRKLADGK